MENDNKKQKLIMIEKKERHIARILKLLQSATLDQLENLEAFIMSYLT